MQSLAFIEFKRLYNYILYILPINVSPSFCLYTTG
jgi:hypothetical protein